MTSTTRRARARGRGLRCGQRRPLLTGPVLGLGVLFLGVGCASAPAPVAGATAVHAATSSAALGSSERLLWACSGGDLSYCQGAVVTVLDLEFEAGRVCTPPDLDFTEAVAAVVA